ncbi:aminodeoxychorismate lyase [Corynebacterium liangguodongii]|uniref:Aminodeoxychorismate lyase n=2 Tax=Corynebacterium liangguodongii TaxID=2079535 RepID=A0A2S0WFZ9_9CORY|nr:aminodeoxychorismate lyase [Corynebacterium liangguodongii]PWB99620.1 aminodeoxychorismate lyase [Corynebacterium liangguodongii]
MESSHLAPQPVIYLVEPFGGSIRRQSPNTPHVFWDDAAVTRGDGIFESILIHRGEAVNLEKHIERFRRSAAALDLPEPGAEHWAHATCEAVADFCRERDSSDGGAPEQAKCVWTMTRGRESTGVPTAWLTVREIDPQVLRQRAEGVKVATAPRGYTIGGQGQEVPWLAVGAKSLNYAASMAAQRWARGRGLDDVIYYDPATGHVLEATTASVVAVKAGRKLRTPPAGPGVLTGTTQQALFAAASERGWRCKARELTVADLLAAESVWLVSSVRLGVRVTQLDGAELGAPGNEEEIRALIGAALGLG